MESNSPYKLATADENGDIELGNTTSKQYDAQTYETGDPTALKMRR
jgi:hypothetical protein